jgi:hypothetical protein
VRIKIYTIFLFISVCGLDASAKKADTSNLSLPVDTAFVRAIQYDGETYKQFKKDKKYDYNHSKVKGTSLWDMLMEKLRRLLGKQLASDTTNWIIVAVVAVILLLIFYFFRPSWFYVNKRRKIGFSVEDETIHGLDFERLIKEALKSGQYATAIRWNYLQVLKSLHSKELISWDAHKTVIEYVYELKRPALKSSFKEASQQFLYYRYGNFEASQQNWEEFRELTQKIVCEVK